MNQSLNTTIMTKEIGIKKSKITIIIKIISITLFYHQNYIHKIASISSKNNKNKHKINN